MVLSTKRQPHRHGHSQNRFAVLPPLPGVDGISVARVMHETAFNSGNPRTRGLYSLPTSGRKFVEAMPGGFSDRLEYSSARKQLMVRKVIGERMNIVKFERKYCARILAFLDSYLNDELLVETTHEVLKHLEDCTSCEKELQCRQHLKSMLKKAAMRGANPASLEARIKKCLRNKSCNN